MCIIISKDAGIPLPSKDILKRCFDGNNDGAGFMYSKNGKVFIQKGYMNFNKLHKAVLKKVDDDTPAVIHCRTATHGSVSRENCHPFPITNRKNLLRSLSVETDIGLAHNGVISIKTEEDLSDTGQFIKDILADDGIRPHLKRPAVLELIAKSINNGRFSFLFGDGKIINLGSTWEEEDGVFYSNPGYEKYTKFNRYKYADGSRFGMFQKFNGHESEVFRNFTEKSTPVTTFSNENYEVKKDKVCPDCFGEVVRRYLNDGKFCGNSWYCIKCDKIHNEEELEDLFPDDEKDTYKKLCKTCRKELDVYDEEEGYGYCTYCGKWIDFNNKTKEEKKLIGV